MVTSHLSHRWVFQKNRQLTDSDSLSDPYIVVRSNSHSFIHARQPGNPCHVIDDLDSNGVVFNHYKGGENATYIGSFQSSHGPKFIWKPNSHNSIDGAITKEGDAVHIAEIAGQWPPTLKGVQMNIVCWRVSRVLVTVGSPDHFPIDVIQGPTFSIRLLSDANDTYPVSVGFLDDCLLRPGLLKRYADLNPSDTHLDWIYGASIPPFLPFPKLWPHLWSSSQASMNALQFYGFWLLISCRRTLRSKLNQRWTALWTFTVSLKMVV